MTTAHNKTPLTIVEYLDVLEDRCRGFIARLKRGVMDKLVLQ